MKTIYATINEGTAIIAGEEEELNKMKKIFPQIVEELYYKSSLNFNDMIGSKLEQVDINTIRGVLASNSDNYEQEKLMYLEQLTIIDIFTSNLKELSKAYQRKIFIELIIAQYIAKRYNSAEVDEKRILLSLARQKKPWKATAEKYNAVVKYSSKDKYPYISWEEKDNKNKVAIQGYNTSSTSSIEAKLFVKVIIENDSLFEFFNWDIEESGDSEDNYLDDVVRELEDFKDNINRQYPVMYIIISKNDINIRINNCFESEKNSIKDTKLEDIFSSMEDDISHYVGVIKNFINLLNRYLNCNEALNNAIYINNIKELFRDKLELFIDLKDFLYNKINIIIKNALMYRLISSYTDQGIEFKP